MGLAYSRQMSMYMHELISGARLKSSSVMKIGIRKNLTKEF